MQINRAVSFLASVLALASFSCSSTKTSDTGGEDTGQEGTSKRSWIPFVGKKEDTGPDPRDPFVKSGERAATAVITNGGEITKIKKFHLSSEEVYRAADPSIPFEAKYRLHGAVSRDERLARYGNYFEVFWKADDQSRPVAVVLEYRQKATGPDVKVKQVPLDRVKRRNVTELRVVGDEYWTDGPVTAWRVSLVQGENVIAADQSFLWE